MDLELKAANEKYLDCAGRAMEAIRKFVERKKETEAWIVQQNQARRQRLRGTLAAERKPDAKETSSMESLMTYDSGRATAVFTDLAFKLTSKTGPLDEIWPKLNRLKFRTPAGNTGPRGSAASAGSGTTARPGDRRVSPGTRSKAPLNSRPWHPPALRERTKTRHFPRSKASRQGRGRRTAST